MEKNSGVLIYCNYSPTYGGNFMCSMLNLAKQIKLEMRSRIVFGFPKSAEKMEWISDVKKVSDYIFFSDMNSIMAGIELGTIMRKNHITIFHVHFVWSKTMFYAGFGLLFNQNVRTYIHVHNHCVRENNIWQHIYRHAIFGRKNFIAISNGVAESLRLNHYRPANIYTVVNAIDFSRLTITHDITEIKDVNGFKCMMFGAAPNRKGVDLALQAISEIRNNQNLDIRLYIPVSVEPQKTVAYIQEILGDVPQWCAILPPIEDIASYYNAVDVFLSPSREEGFCYATVEAYYCEKPVIASKISGQGEISLSNIRWIESESVSELEAAILNCFSEKICTKGQKEEAFEKYGIERWTYEMVNVFKDQ